MLPAPRRGRSGSVYHISHTGVRPEPEPRAGGGERLRRVPELGLSTGPPPGASQTQASLEEKPRSGAFGTADPPGTSVRVPREPASQAAWETSPRSRGGREARLGAEGAVGGDTALPAKLRSSG